MFNSIILKLLLSVVVSINNTSSTFPTAYYYITLELAISFKQVGKQLTDLAFEDCLSLLLLLATFLKDLV